MRSRTLHALRAIASLWMAFQVVSVPIAKAEKPTSDQVAHEEKSSTQPEFKFDWLTFRVNQLTLIYFNQVSMTGGAYWAPGVTYQNLGGFRLQLGLNLIKAHSDSLTLFYAPEAQGLLFYTPFQWLILEAGMGFQHWSILDARTMTLYTGQIHYRFSSPLLGFVDSVYLGYTGMKDYQIHSQYRLGFQISF